jgi:sortase A
MTIASRTAAIRRLRWFCLSAGGLLLAFVGAARLHSELSSDAGLEAFRQARVATGAAAPAPAAAPDQSLWDAKRVAKYAESLQVDFGLPLGVLRIPRLALEVPIWNGIDELTLNRGLGRIPGTAHPGTPGNLGIAGHRDGFFRVLKEIVAGDEIELETLAGAERFEVERTLIVTPDDVWVLAPTPEPSLTLVTCHPFYYSGKAPERFVVRAAVRRVEETVSTLPAERGGDVRTDSPERSMTERSTQGGKS